MIDAKLDTPPPGGAPLPTIGRWWYVGAITLLLLAAGLWLTGHGPGAASCGPPILSVSTQPDAALSAALPAIRP
jgi:hypothetical protein